MARIVVFGASGTTGGLAVEVLSGLGVPVVAAGRDAARVRARVGHLEAVEDVRVADARDGAALRHVLADADVVVSTAGPFTALGRGVLEAAIDTGTHYVDSTGELPFVRWAVDEAGSRADDAGVCVVPAAGYDFLPGDLLSARACGAVEQPREVHVTYLVRGRGPLPGYTTPGTRASVAEVLGEPALALVDGTLVEEALAAQRRLAWFPKPVGPHHAAGFPGTEPLTVPRHVPGVRTVRTYLATPTLVAELTQAAATLAGGSDRIRAGLGRLLRSSDRGPSADQRARVRWACVAEARGEDGTVARAWINGRDIYGFTAHALVVVAEALAAGPTVRGVVAPAEVVEPTAALDTLAERAGSRWGVTQPAS